MVIMRKRLAFTLMEVLLVVGIVSALFGIVAPLLLQANRVFILSRTRVQLQQEARSTMYLLTRNLRQAQSDTIVLSRASSSQPFYSKIEFTKVQGGDMVFQQEGTVLYQVIGGGKKALTRNLRYLAFTFPRSDDMGIISVSITLEQTIYEGRKKALHMASEKVMIMN